MHYKAPIQPIMLEFLLEAGANDKFSSGSAYAFGTTLLLM
jgi:hypothetical protein